MKKFKFVCKRILLVFLLIVGIMFIWLLARMMVPMIYNPMRRTAPMIRNHILRHTPIGMCIEEVIEVIENNERWGTPTVNRNNGFFHPGPSVPGWPICPISGSSIIGDQSVQTRPEIYNVILFHERRTRIFWGFDENGKLIEVFVSSSFAPRLVE